MELDSFVLSALFSHRLSTAWKQRILPKTFNTKIILNFVKKLTSLRQIYSSWFFFVFSSKLVDNDFFSLSFNVCDDIVRMFLSCFMTMNFLWLLNSWLCLLKCLQAVIALVFLTSFLWLLSQLLNDVVDLPTWFTFSKGYNGKRAKGFLQL